MKYPLNAAVVTGACCGRSLSVVMGCLVADGGLSSDVLLCLVMSCHVHECAASLTGSLRITAPRPFDGSARSVTRGQARMKGEDVPGRGFEHVIPQLAMLR